MTRKTKAALAADLLAAGFKVTSSRREGKVDVGTDKLPLSLRWITVLVPGMEWSQEDGDWAAKGKMRANERRIIKAIKDACGKPAHFDLIDHDMGHSETGESADDAHLHFYAYTAD